MSDDAGARRRRGTACCPRRRAGWSRRRAIGPPPPLRRVNPRRRAAPTQSREAGTMMRMITARISLVAIGLVAFGPSSVNATNSESACCACLPAEVDGFDGEPPPLVDQVAALLCGELSPPQIPPFQAQCAALGGKTLCLRQVCATEGQQAECQGDHQNHLSCATQLLSEDIVCPATPAPAVGLAPLGVLAVALAGLGAGLLARQRRRGAYRPTRTARRSAQRRVQGSG